MIYISFFVVFCMRTSKRLGLGEFDGYFIDLALGLFSSVFFIGIGYFFLGFSHFKYNFVLSVLNEFLA